MRHLRSLALAGTTLALATAGCGADDLGLASEGAISAEQFEAIEKRTATPESVIAELGTPLGDERRGTGSARIRCVGYQREDKPSGAYSFCFDSEDKLFSKDAD